MKKPSRKIWLLIGIAATTVAASAGLVALAPEPDRRAIVEDAVPVTTVVAEVRARAPHASLYGRVETPKRAGLSALVAAEVAALGVREGDRVAEGEVLVRLDETDARLLLRRRQADLVDAKAEREALKLGGLNDAEALAHQEELHRLAEDKVARHRELRERSSISEELLNGVLNESHAQAIALARQRHLVNTFEHRLAQAEAQVARAEAALEEASVGLERTRIRAPFQGRVTAIAVAPGERVSPGAVVVEMYDDRALEIRVHIPNAHLPGLQRVLAAGLRPEARVDFGDRLASGRLTRLKGAVDAGQSGVDGLVVLDPGTRPPDLGRAVGLRVTLPQVDNTVAVPLQAVYGQARLFLVEDGALLGIDVERLGETTGPQGEPQLLVRAAELKDGARILSSQLSNAVTGLRVRDERAGPVGEGSVGSQAA